MHVSESIAIDAAPDKVWRIAGDIGNVSRWIPALESSRLEGDIRHADFAGGGGSARERIVERDDAARYYVYEYLDGPLALKEYRSRFAVQAQPNGTSLVTWDSYLTAGSAEEEGALAKAISGIYADALAKLAGQFRP
ncbi:MAG TPA: SRPBCC family protein [Jatrophihabitantaceae bacterium]|jgi:uncharacterized membrane protein